MTDEPAPAPEPNEYQKMRDEFTAQFTELKKSFESSISELKTQNEELTKHNQELQRALIRSATNPAPTEPELSEEDKYTQLIDKLAKQTLSKM